VRGPRQLLGAALLVASCATSPLRARDAHFTGYLPIPPGQSRLYVYRPETSIKTPRDEAPMEVDSRPLAHLGRDEYVSITLPPGTHRLGASPPAATGYNPHPPARVFELEADRATYCRVFPIPEGVVFLWDIRCGKDPEAHAALRECTAAPLDRTVDWQP
jgi:hypothetical protein